MAKRTLRELTAQLSWQEVDTEWNAWLRENNPTYREKNYQELDELAKSSGVDIATLREQNHEEYQALREEFQETLKEIAEDKQQKLTVKNNLLDSYCAVYQKADRILTGGLDIEVRIGTPADGVEAPAWNDGKVISFNESIINGVDENTLIGLHGLNFHEVAHLLYSPRIGSDLGAWVKENNYQTSFNILEDNRAETFLVTKYPATRNFLLATLGEYIIRNSGERLGDSFILLAGRKYFSYDCRTSIGKLYAEKHGLEQAKKVYYLINKYRTLVFPRDYAIAKDIITEFSSLVPEGTDTPNGCGSRSPLKNGRPETGKEQEALNISDPETDPDLNPTDKNHSHGHGGNDETNLPKAEQADRQQDALDRLTDEVNRAKNNSDVVNKIKETQKSISKSNANKTILTKQNAPLKSPTGGDVATVRAFATELERLRIEADPAWGLEKPSGRLNKKRAMNANINDINKLFDRWEQGNDNHEIEAVLLVDKSGSMYRDIEAVSRAGWVINRAIEKIQGRVTILSYNHNSKVLYDGDEKAKSDYKSLDCSGGTNPHFALVETERIMKASIKPTKLVIMLTDGGFYEGDEIIQRLNDMGTTTVMVFLGEPYMPIEQLAHGAQVFRAIADPRGLVKVAKDIVRKRLRSSR